MIKMARKFHSHNGQPERYRIITFEGAFHGRTLATIAAGNQEKHLAGFGPKVDGFDQVPLGDLEAMRAAITPETAGILIEPLQGEGGVRYAGWAFLRDSARTGRRAWTFFLILDEVQTGIGRTGKLFAYEWAGIEPDILGVAKGLGGGFPIGACLATDARRRAWWRAATDRPSAAIRWRRPSAMPCSTSCSTRRFFPKCAAKSLLLKQKTRRNQRHLRAVIEDVRGEGLLLGLKCRIPNTTLDRRPVRRKIAHHLRWRQYRAVAAAPHHRRRANQRRLQQNLHVCATLSSQPHHNS